MFEPDQVVVCETPDDELPNGGHSESFAALKKTAVYHVAQFTPPAQCAAESSNKIVNWTENGGRVELVEMPKCYFFGRRFNAA